MCKGTYGIMQTSNITIFPNFIEATSFKNFSPFSGVPLFAIHPIPEPACSPDIC